MLEEIYHMFNIYIYIIFLQINSIEIEMYLYNIYMEPYDEWINIRYYPGHVVQ